MVSSMLTLQQCARGFEKVLEKLPGALRRPVEREWQPIRELFLNRRPPRILVVGEPGEATELWTKVVFGMDPLAAFEADAPPWRRWNGRGVLFLALAEDEAAAREMLKTEKPDLILYQGAGESADMALLRGEVPGIFGGGASREAILHQAARLLPMEARLEFARASGEAPAQREIAAALTRSTTAVCAAIGMQPIPLADFPILTSLQVLMVSGIVHTTGREWNGRLVRDFLGALGVNVGLGLVFRESARAAMKLVPGWGNAVSGAVAGAGTYAIGRAATVFFIEGASMEESRRQFRLFRGKK